MKEPSSTPSRRSYGQSCPVAHALDLVGDRWALLVIRELRLGPRRFADLDAALPGIGPSVLSQRLRELVAVGVLERTPLPPPGRGEMYRLTTWGAELEPVFRALARWGAGSPVVPLRGPISDDAVMLGVRTFLELGRPEMPASGRLAVALERERYALDVAEGRLTRLVRGDFPPGIEAEARLQTDATTVQALLIGRATPATVIGAGRVQLSGAEALSGWFLSAVTGRAA